MVYLWITYGLPMDSLWVRWRSIFGLYWN